MKSSKLILILVLQGGSFGSGESGGDRGSLGKTMGPTLSTIFANCATCSWETLTMLNPQFVAGEHGLFWGPLVRRHSDYLYSMQD